MVEIFGSLALAALGFSMAVKNIPIYRNTFKPYEPLEPESRNIEKLII